MIQDRVSLDLHVSKGDAFSERVNYDHRSIILVLNVLFNII
jgi:hypothetical protein